MSLKNVDPYRVARKKMISEQLIARGIHDKRVLEAIGKIPRHLFVSPGMESQAYEDRPLPIGYEQTISQPYIVALMTQLLKIKGGEKILEIGTGSGYQTAVLAEMGCEICTIERISSLSIQARRIIYNLPVAKRVKFRIGDGTAGWADESPFDLILVSAGAPKIPTALCEQLKDGGRMVIPVGAQDFQVLIRVTREGNNYKKEELTGCRFVKLIGEGAWK